MDIKSYQALVPLQCKKAKVGHYTAEIVIEIVDRNVKIVPIRGLLDTGTTGEILLRKEAPVGAVVIQQPGKQWVVNLLPRRKFCLSYLLCF